MEARPSFLETVGKTIVTHTVTYFAMGLLASTVFDYKNLYADTALRLLMRQTTDPLVMSGPLFQPIRGFLFGIAFFLLRNAVFSRKYSWLVMWLALAVFGILGPFGPAPGSIEGVIYTVIPVEVQLIGLPEVVLQSLLLSVVLIHWVRHPKSKWLSWVLGIAFVLVMLLPALGLFLGNRV